MMTTSSVMYAILVAAGCLTIWLAVSLLQSTDKNTDRQGRPSPPYILRYLFSVVLLIAGLGTIGVAIFSPALKTLRPDNDANAILVGDRMQGALESIVENRFVDTASVEVIEEWLNLYVRPAPQTKTTRTLTVIVELPTRIREKITSGETLTNSERIHLLEWAAFDVDLEFTAPVESLVRMLAIGEELDSDDRRLLAEWMADASNFPRRRKTSMPLRQWPNKVEPVDPSATPPAPAAPSAAPPAPSAASAGQVPGSNTRIVTARAA